VGMKKIISDMVLAAALLLLFWMGALSYFDFRLQDALFQRPGLPHPDIVVIGIDEQAIEYFGIPTDWSREIMASAIEILNTCEEYRPAVIAIDVLYVGEREPVADERLAAAAEHGGNVLVAARAVVGYIQSEHNPALAVRGLVGLERPFAALAEHADYAIVNAIHDADGRIRSTRLLYEYQGEVLYSFPYKIYREIFGVAYSGESWDGEMYIIYHGPSGTYKQFSFADIFADGFEPEFLADTIVMIGAFAPGLFDDFQVPGHAERMFGVEIHANILQMLIDGVLVRYAPWWANLLALFLMLAAVLVLANLLEIRLLLASYAGLAGAFFAAAFLLFSFGYIISMVYVVAVLVVVYIYQLIYGYVLERIERRKAELIAEKHQILIDSINYASVVQRGILPKDSLFSQVFADSSVIWNPRDTVGGDIYWLKEFEKGALLAVCDCTGHGVPGALLTALVVSSFEEIVNEETCGDTSSIIYELDQRLVRIFETEGGRSKNGCDLAVLFIARDGEVSISAGNINVFVCNGTDVNRIKGQRIYVGEGKLASSADVRVTTVPASQNNKFYISSDGLYDQIGGAHGRSFGYRGFKQLILEHHGEEQAVVSEKVWEAFENYRGGHVRLDDFELVSFRPFVAEQ